jgi:uncharacterized membrane protein YcgQ (UPF0703/DUF1980 family)
MKGCFVMKKYAAMKRCVAGKRSFTMKRCFAIILLLLLLAGCNGNPSSANLLPENIDGTATSPESTKDVTAPEAPAENSNPVASGSESSSGSSDAVISPVNTSGDVVEIKEKMFIAQCNDIYLNPGDYIGKTIRIEGMYDEYSDDAGNTYQAVIRNGPGCCGNDGVAGFEFLCEGVPEFKRNDWISIEGIIRPFAYDDGYETVIIGNASITVKTERGAEYVTQ